MTKKRKPDTSQCKTCAYWEKLSRAGFSAYACHFLLRTNTSRLKDAAGKCLEYQKK